MQNCVRHKFIKCMSCWVAVCSGVVDNSVTITRCSHSVCLHLPRDIASGPGHCIVSVSTLASACQPWADFRYSVQLSNVTYVHLWPAYQMNIFLARWHLLWLMNMSFGWKSWMFNCFEVNLVNLIVIRGNDNSELEVCM